MDMTKEIMNKWYSAMETNKISVQPKAATILGTILAEYDIKQKDEPRDIWSEFLTIDDSQFLDWYTALSEDDKTIFQKQREKARKNQGNKRSLLKG
jgi:hypothetical protein|tara:strand:+ start:98 stop:385 length:288 start_codon:yes stop_codon:yes gene_type:complete